MSDDRLTNLKAKLMAEKEKADALAVEQAEAQARAEAERANAKKMFEEKRGLTEKVVAALNDQLAETGVELRWRTAPPGPRNTEIERQQVAMRELGSEDTGLDKMSLLFGETGKVTMFFGTKNQHPAGQGDCRIEEFDAEQLQAWILDFIETNVDHEARTRRW